MPIKKTSTIEKGITQFRWLNSVKVTFSFRCFFLSPSTVLSAGYISLIFATISASPAVSSSWLTFATISEANFIFSWYVQSFSSPYHFCRTGLEKTLLSFCEKNTFGILTFSLILPKKMGRPGSSDMPRSWSEPSGNAWFRNSRRFSVLSMGNCLSSFSNDISQASERNCSRAGFMPFSRQYFTESSSFSFWIPENVSNTNWLEMDCTFFLTEF